MRVMKCGVIGKATAMVIGGPIVATDAADAISFCTGPTIDDREGGRGCNELFVVESTPQSIAEI